MDGWGQIITIIVGLGGAVTMIIKSQQKQMEKLLNAFLKREEGLIATIADNAKSNEKVCSSSDKVALAVDRLDDSINKVQTCPFNEQVLYAIKENLKQGGGNL